MLAGEHDAPCVEAPTDVDHVGEPDDHDVVMLRGLCSIHHDRRTSQQGNAARWAHRAGRPAERHPGMIDPTSDVDHW